MIVTQKIPFINLNKYFNALNIKDEQVSSLETSQSFTVIRIL